MITKETITKILQGKKSELSEKYHLTTIGIFGSVLREDFRDESDIDILIDYDQQLGVEFIDLAEELESILERKVDLVSRKGIKPKYFDEICRELIYV